MPKKAKDLQYYESVGRRKASVARVRLYISSKKQTAKSEAVKAGEIIVNNKPLTEYFGTLVLQRQASQPFRLTENEKRFATTIKVIGGGTQGQLEAIILGISRALCLASIIHPS
jgi:small subunit ribosomal protein S9